MIRSRFVHEEELTMATVDSPAGPTTGTSLSPAHPPTCLPTEWSVADLQAHLGGIPLDRIRLYPPPGMATEQDALDIADHEDRWCELVDGILVEKVMATFESLVACILIQWLNNFLEKNQLGIVLGEGGALRILPTRMRIPDVSFIRWERFPGRKLPRVAVFRVAPDLAVEILSEGNTEGEMQIKVAEYFRAGVRLVWLLDPEDRSARVYTSADQFEVLDENGFLDGRDVLPGFHFRLRDLIDAVPREAK
jgi:Uma2 family endonuclease